MAGYNIVLNLQIRGITGLEQAAGRITRTLQSALANAQRDARVNLRVDDSSLRKIRELDSSLTSLRENINRTNAQTISVQTQRPAIPTSYGPLASASTTQNISGGFSAVNEQLRQGKDLAEAFGRQIGSITRRYVSFIATQGAIVGVVEGFQRMTSEAVNFEKTLIRISQVSGANDKELREISREIGGIATSTGVSSKELGESSLTFRQAGFSKEDTRNLVAVTAESALAPNFDSVAKTTEGAIAIMRQFQLSSEDARDALSSVNAVASAFAVEGRDIIEAVRRAGGAFASLAGETREPKRELNEFISLFSSVRATTRESAESIATGLRTIFARLQKIETVEALKALGINLRYTREEAEKLGNLNLQDQFVGGFEAVKRLSDGLRGIRSTDSRFSAVVEELGGQRQISRVLPLIQQFPEAQAAFQVAQAGNKSFDFTTERAQDSLANKMDKVREAYLALGRSLLEDQGFKKLINSALELSEGFAKALEFAKPLLTTMLTLAAVRIVSATPAAFSALQSGLRGEEVYQKPTLGAAPLRRASGGWVPGMGNTDSVDAMLTPGEFVIRKSSSESLAQEYPGLLEALNQGKSPQEVIPIQEANRGGTIRFASGGFVGNNIEKYLLLQLVKQKESEEKQKYATGNKVSVSTRVPQVDTSPFGNAHQFALKSGDIPERMVKFLSRATGADFYRGVTLANSSIVDPSQLKDEGLSSPAGVFIPSARKIMIASGRNEVDSTETLFHEHIHDVDYDRRKRVFKSTQKGNPFEKFVSLYQDSQVFQSSLAQGSSFLPPEKIAKYQEYRKSPQELLAFGAQSLLDKIPQSAEEEILMAEYQKSVLPEIVRKYGVYDPRRIEYAKETGQAFNQGGLLPRKYQFAGSVSKLTWEEILKREKFDPKNPAGGKLREQYQNKRFDKILHKLSEATNINFASFFDSGLNITPFDTRSNQYTASVKSSGVHFDGLYNKKGIFINQNKDDSFVASSLAHELTHYADNQLYKNVFSGFLDKKDGLFSEIESNPLEKFISLYRLTDEYRNEMLKRTLSGKRTEYFSSNNESLARGVEHLFKNAGSKDKKYQSLKKEFYSTVAPLFREVFGEYKPPQRRANGGLLDRINNFPSDRPELQRKFLEEFKASGIVLPDPSKHIFEEGARERIRELGIDEQHYLSLVGAGDLFPSTTKVFNKELSTLADYKDSQGHFLSRMVTSNKTGIDVQNTKLVTSKESATSIYGKQLAAALAFPGTVETTSSAIGKYNDPEGYSGYLVWPKFGMNAEIPTMTYYSKQKMREYPEFANFDQKAILDVVNNRAATIQDLLKVPGGELYWKYFGQEFDAKYKPTDELILQKHIERLQSAKTKKKFQVGGFLSEDAGTGVDTVPALLTPGEFVFNKDAAARIGLRNLHILNQTGDVGKAFGLSSSFGSAFEEQYAQAVNRGGVIQKFALGGGVGVQRFKDGSEVKFVSSKDGKLEVRIISADNRNLSNDQTLTPEFIRNVASGAGGLKDDPRLNQIVGSIVGVLNVLKNSFEGSTEAVINFSKATGAVFGDRQHVKFSPVFPGGETGGTMTSTIGTLTRSAGYIEKVRQQVSNETGDYLEARTGQRELPGQKPQPTPTPVPTATTPQVATTQKPPKLVHPGFEAIFSNLPQGEDLIKGREKSLEEISKLIGKPPGEVNASQVLGLNYPAGKVGDNTDNEAIFSPAKTLLSGGGDRDVSGSIGQTSPNLILELLKRYLKAGSGEGIPPQTQRLYAKRFADFDWEILKGNYQISGLNKLPPKAIAQTHQGIIDDFNTGKLERGKVQNESEKRFSALVDSQTSPITQPTTNSVTENASGYDLMVKESERAKAIQRAEGIAGIKARAIQLKKDKKKLARFLGVKSSDVVYDNIKDNNEFSLSHLLERDDDDSKFNGAKSIIPINSDASTIYDKKGTGEESLRYLHDKIYPSLEDVVAALKGQTSFSGILEPRGILRGTKGFLAASKRKLGFSKDASLDENQTAEVRRLAIELAEKKTLQARFASKLPSVDGKNRHRDIFSYLRDVVLEKQDSPSGKVSTSELFSHFDRFSQGTYDIRPGLSYFLTRGGFHLSSDDEQPSSQEDGPFPFVEKGGEKFSYVSTRKPRRQKSLSSPLQQDKIQPHASKLIQPANPTTANPQVATNQQAEKTFQIHRGANSLPTDDTNKILRIEVTPPGGEGKWESASANIGELDKLFPGDVKLPQIIEAVSASLNILKESSAQVSKAIISIAPRINKDGMVSRTPSGRYNEAATNVAVDTLANADGLKKRLVSPFLLGKRKEAVQDAIDAASINENLPADVVSHSQEVTKETLTSAPVVKPQSVVAPANEEVIPLFDKKDKVPQQAVTKTSSASLPFSLQDVKSEGEYRKLQEFLRLAKASDNPEIKKLAGEIKGNAGKEKIREGLRGLFAIEQTKIESKPATQIEAKPEVRPVVLPQPVSNNPPAIVQSERFPPPALIETPYNGPFYPLKPNLPIHLGNRPDRLLGYNPSARSASHVDFIQPTYQTPKIAVPKTFATDLDSTKDYEYPSLGENYSDLLGRISAFSAPTQKPVVTPTPSNRKFTYPPTPEGKRDYSLVKISEDYPEFVDDLTQMVMSSVIGTLPKNDTDKILGSKRLFIGPKKRNGATLDDFRVNIPLELQEQTKQESSILPVSPVVTPATQPPIASVQTQPQKPNALGKSLIQISGTETDDEDYRFFLRNEKDADLTRGEIKKFQLQTRDKDTKELIPEFNPRVIQTLLGSFELLAKSAKDVSGALVVIPKDVNQAIQIRAGKLPSVTDKLATAPDFENQTRLRQLSPVELPGLQYNGSFGDVPSGLFSGIDVSFLEKQKRQAGIGKVGLTQNNAGRLISAYAGEDKTLGEYFSTLAQKGGPNEAVKALLANVISSAGEVGITDKQSEKLATFFRGLPTSEAGKANAGVIKLTSNQDEAGFSPLALTELEKEESQFQTTSKAIALNNLRNPFTLPEGAKRATPTDDLVNLAKSQGTDKDFPPREIGRLISQSEHREGVFRDKNAGIFYTTPEDKRVKINIPDYREYRAYKQAKKDAKGEESRGQAPAQLSVIGGKEHTFDTSTSGLARLRDDLEDKPSDTLEEISQKDSENSKVAIPSNLLAAIRQSLGGIKLDSGKFPTKKLRINKQPELTISPSIAELDSLVNSTRDTVRIGSSGGQRKFAETVQGYAKSEDGAESVIAQIQRQLLEQKVIDKKGVVLKDGQFGAVVDDKFQNLDNLSNNQIPKDATKTLRIIQKSLNLLENTIQDKLPEAKDAVLRASKTEEGFSLPAFLATTSEIDYGPKTEKPSLAIGATKDSLRKADDEARIRERINKVAEENRKQISAKEKAEQDLRVIPRFPYALPVVPNPALSRQEFLTPVESLVPQLASTGGVGKPPQNPPVVVAAPLPEPDGQARKTTTLPSIPLNRSIVFNPPPVTPPPLPSRPTSSVIPSSDLFSITRGSISTSLGGREDNFIPAGKYLGLGLENIPTTLPDNINNLLMAAISQIVSDANAAGDNINLEDKELKAMALSAKMAILEKSKKKRTPNIRRMGISIPFASNVDSDATGYEILSLGKDKNEIYSSGAVLSPAGLIKQNASLNEFGLSPTPQIAQRVNTQNPVFPVLTPQILPNTSAKPISFEGGKSYGDALKLNFKDVPNTLPRDIDKVIKDAIGKIAPNLKNDQSLSYIATSVRQALQEVDTTAKTPDKSKVSVRVPTFSGAEPNTEYDVYQNTSGTDDYVRTGKLPTPRELAAARNVKLPSLSAPATVVVQPVSQGATPSATVSPPIAVTTTSPGNGPTPTPSQTTTPKPNFSTNFDTAKQTIDFLSKFNNKTKISDPFIPKLAEINTKSSLIQGKPDELQTLDSAIFDVVDDVAKRKAANNPKNVIPETFGDTTPEEVSQLRALAKNLSLRFNRAKVLEKRQDRPRKLPKILGSQDVLLQNLGQDSRYFPTSKTRSIADIFADSSKSGLLSFSKAEKDILINAPQLARGENADAINQELSQLVFGAKFDQDLTQEFTTPISKQQGRILASISRRLGKERDREKKSLLKPVVVSGQPQKTIDAASTAAFGDSVPQLNKGSEYLKVFDDYGVRFKKEVRGVDKGAYLFDEKQFQGMALLAQSEIFGTKEERGVLASIANRGLQEKLGPGEKRAIRLEKEAQSLLNSYQKRLAKEIVTSPAGQTTQSERVSGFIPGKTYLDNDVVARSILPNEKGPSYKKSLGGNADFLSLITSQKRLEDGSFQITATEEQAANLRKLLEDSRPVDTSKELRGLTPEQQKAKISQLREEGKGRTQINPRVRAILESALGNAKASVASSGSYDIRLNEDEASAVGELFRTGKNDISGIPGIENQFIREQRRARKARRASLPDYFGDVEDITKVQKALHQNRKYKDLSFLEALQLDEQDLSVATQQGKQIDKKNIPLLSLIQSLESPNLSRAEIVSTFQGLRQGVPLPKHSREDTRPTTDYDDTIFKRAQQAGRLGRLQSFLGFKGGPGSKQVDVLSKNLDFLTIGRGEDGQARAINDRDRELLARGEATSFSVGEQEILGYKGGQGRAEIFADFASRSPEEQKLINDAVAKRNALIEDGRKSLLQRTTNDLSLAGGAEVLPNGKRVKSKPVDVLGSRGLLIKPEYLAENLISNRSSNKQAEADRLKGSIGGKAFSSPIPLSEISSSFVDDFTKTDDILQKQALARKYALSGAGREERQNVFADTIAPTLGKPGEVPSAGLARIAALFDNELDDKNQFRPIIRSSGQEVSPTTLVPGGVSNLEQEKLAGGSKLITLPGIVGNENLPPEQRLQALEKLDRIKKPPVPGSGSGLGEPQGSSYGLVSYNQLVSQRTDAEFERLQRAEAQPTGPVFSPTNYSRKTGILSTEVTGGTSNNQVNPITETDTLRFQGQAEAQGRADVRGRVLTSLISSTRANFQGASEDKILAKAQEDLAKMEANDNELIKQRQILSNTQDPERRALAQARIAQLEKEPNLLAYDKKLAQDGKNIDNALLGSKTNVEAAKLQQAQIAAQTGLQGIQFRTLRTVLDPNAGEAGIYDELRERGRAKTDREIEQLGGKGAVSESTQRRIEERNTRQERNNFERQFLAAEARLIKALNKEADSAEVAMRARENYSKVMSGQLDVALDKDGKVIGSAQNVALAASQEKSIKAPEPTWFERNISQPLGQARAGFGQGVETAARWALRRQEENPWIGRVGAGLMSYPALMGLPYLAQMAQGQIAGGFNSNVKTAEDAVKVGDFSETAYVGSKFVEGGISGLTTGAILGSAGGQLISTSVFSAAPMGALGGVGGVGAGAGAASGATLGPIGAVTGALVVGAISARNAMLEASSEIRKVKIANALAAFADRLQSVTKLIQVGGTDTALEISAREELEKVRRTSTEENRYKATGFFGFDRDTFDKLQVKSLRNEFSNQIPQLVQNLQTQTEQLVRKSDLGKTITPAEIFRRIESGNSGLNKAQIDIINKTKQANPEIFQKEFERLIKQQIDSEKNRRESAEASKNVDINSTAFNRIPESFLAAEYYQRPLRAQQRVSADLFNETVSATPIDFGAEAANRILTSPLEALSAAKTLQSTGIPQTDILTKRIDAIGKVAEILPDVIQQVQGLSIGLANKEDSPGTRITELLRKRLGDTNADTGVVTFANKEVENVISSVRGAINKLSSGESGPTGFLEKIQTRDVSALTGELLASEAQAAQKGLGDGLRLLQQNTQELSREFAELSRRGKVLRAIQDRENQVELIGIRTRRGFEAENNFNTSLGVPSLAELKRPFDESIKNLLSETGRGGANTPAQVPEILNRLTEVSAEIRRREAALVSGGGFRGKDGEAGIKLAGQNILGATSELNKLKETASRLQESLSKFGDVTTRNAAITERLNVLKQEEQARFSLAERIATATPQDMSELNRGLLLLKQAYDQNQKGGATLFDYSSRDRQLMLNVARSGGAATSEAFGGRSFNDVLKLLLSRTPTGLNFGFDGLKEKRGVLQNEALQNIDEGQAALAGSRAFKQNEVTQVLQGIKDIQRDFFTKLEAIFARQSANTTLGELSLLKDANKSTIERKRAFDNLGAAKVFDPEKDKPETQLKKVKALKTAEEDFQAIQIYETQKKKYEVAFDKTDIDRNIDAEKLRPYKVNYLDELAGFTNARQLNDEKRSELTEYLQKKFAIQPDRASAISASIQDKLAYNSTSVEFSMRRNSAEFRRLPSEQQTQEIKEARQSYLRGLLKTELDKEGGKQRAKAEAAEARIGRSTENKELLGQLRGRIDSAKTPEDVDKIFVDILNPLREIGDIKELGNLQDDFAKFQQSLNALTDTFNLLNENAKKLEIGAGIRPKPEFSPRPSSVYFETEDDIFGKLRGFSAGGNTGSTQAGRVINEPNSSAFPSSVFIPSGTDTIPAMLTKGEYVVNAAATAKHLPLLEAINSGQGPATELSNGGAVYLAEGGEVTPWQKRVAEYRKKYPNYPENRWRNSLDDSGNNSSGSALFGIAISPILLPTSLATFAISKAARFEGRNKRIERIRNEKYEQDVLDNDDFSIIIKSFEDDRLSIYHLVDKSKMAIRNNTPSLLNNRFAQELISNVGKINNIRDEYRRGTAFRGRYVAPEVLSNILSEMQQYEDVVKSISRYAENVKYANTKATTKNSYLEILNSEDWRNHDNPTSKTILDRFTKNPVDFFSRDFNTVKQDLGWVAAIQNLKSEKKEFQQRAANLKSLSAAYSSFFSDGVDFKDYAYSDVVKEVITEAYSANKISDRIPEIQKEKLYRLRESQKKFIIERIKENGTANYSLYEGWEEILSTPSPGRDVSDKEKFWLRFFNPTKDYSTPPEAIASPRTEQEQISDSKESTVTSPIVIAQPKIFKSESRAEVKPRAIDIPKEVSKPKETDDDRIRRRIEEIARERDALPRRRFAKGGMVPGVGSSDTVNALLTPGEFVIPKAATEILGKDLLQNMIQKPRLYAAGGAVENFLKKPNQLPLAQGFEYFGKLIEDGQRLIKQEKSIDYLFFKDAVANPGGEAGRLFNEIMPKNEKILPRLPKQIRQAIRVMNIGEEYSLEDARQEAIRENPGRRKYYESLPLSAFESLRRKMSLNNRESGKRYTTKELEELEKSIDPKMLAVQNDLQLLKQQQVLSLLPDLLPGERIQNDISSRSLGEKLASNRSFRNRTTTLEKYKQKRPNFLPFGFRPDGIRLDGGPVIGVGNVNNPFQNPIRRMSGGLVYGQGRGDIIPALLEPGEFVLNRDAVAKAGVKQLERFNTGGLVGESGKKPFYAQGSGISPQVAQKQERDSVTQFSSGEFARAALSLAPTLTEFAQAARELADALKSFPRSLSMQGSQDININLSGADALKHIGKDLEGAVGDMVKQKIEEALRRFFPDA